MPYKDPEKRKEVHRKSSAKRRANGKTKEYDLRWRKENPEKYRERERKRYTKRRESPEFRAKEIIKKKKWNKGNPKKVKEYRLKDLGWTLEMYNTTSEEQGGRCMICRKLPIGKGSRGGNSVLAADHRHTNPPEPRALLCNRCNSLMGFAKHSPE